MHSPGNSLRRYDGGSKKKNSSPVSLASGDVSTARTCDVEAANGYAEGNNSVIEGSGAVERAD